MLFIQKRQKMEAKCWRFVRMVYQFDAKGRLMNGVQKLFILKTLTTYLKWL